MPPLEQAFERIAELLASSGIAVEMLPPREARDVHARWRREFGDWRRASLEPGRHTCAGTRAAQVYEDFPSDDYVIGTLQSNIVLRCRGESGRLPALEELRRAIEVDAHWEVFVADWEVTWTFVFVDEMDGGYSFHYLEAVEAK